MSFKLIESEMKKKKNNKNERNFEDIFEVI